MKNILAITGILLSTITFGQVQSFDFYSFRLDNMFNVNPAYANSADLMQVYVGGVAQNRGVESNTKNLTAGIFSKFSKSQGLGGNIITDARGAFQTTKATISYAYTARFSPEAKISFGLNAGILASGINTSRIEGYDLLDKSDFTLNSNYFNRNQFITGAGLLFQWKKLDVSLALPHIIATDANLNAYTHAATQYTFDLKRGFQITPSFVFQHLDVVGQVYSGFIQGTYKKMVWLKGGYQSNDLFYAMAGFNVENIGFGYSYRINNNDFANIATGSHELVLKIQIGKKAKEVKYNPTLIEIDHRLTKLLNKKVTDDNRNELIDEVRKIEKLMENTEINNSTPEAANEARLYLGKIESKLIELQKKLDEKQ